MKAFHDARQSFKKLLLIFALTKLMCYRYFNAHIVIEKEETQKKVKNSGIWSKKQFVADAPP